MKNVKRVLSIILCISILFSGVLSVQAAQDVPQKTIRVGFFESTGYHCMDENGIRSGYGYDFLQMILRYNDWKYEYVGYDKNWGDMLDMLDSGEIDMVTLADKTPERLLRFDYSAKSIGYSATIMTKNEQNSGIIQGDYSTYNGARIGLVTNSSHNEGFEEFARQHGFSYTPVYYDDVEELVRDIQDGQNIDIAVTSNMRQVEGEQILDQFDATDYYAVVKKGNEELLTDLDAAIEQLDIYSPDWRNLLYQKYYYNTNASVLSLTTEERSYLSELANNKTVIKAAMNPELKPYSYFEDGEAKGIVPEIFKLIASDLGISYEILPSTDRMEYKKQLQDGEADIDLTAFCDYSIAQEYNLKETDGYMTTSVAMVSRGDSLVGGETMMVATVEDPTEFAGFNEQLLNQNRCMTYGSIEECVEAVKNGACDVTYQYVYMAENAVAADYKNQLKYTILSDCTFELCVGVINTEDHRLLSVLNKSIDSLSASDVNRIMMEQSRLALHKEGTIDFIYDQPYLVLVIAIIGLLIIFGFVLLLIRNRNQKQKLIAAQQLEERNLALKDALQNAQSANSAKGIFVSKISHEIRTPLNAIIGYLNMAEEAPEDVNQVVHCIKNGKLASEHLLDLINDVLDLSAIENNKMKIYHEDFDIKTLITTISSIYYNQAQMKHVKFQVNINGLTEEHVIGDALRMKQILMNLLSNAVKFTPEGGQITLTITQIAQDEKKDHIQFTVQDSGIGMEQEFIDRIFDPFEQENSSVAQNHGGSGLGLSITKNLVDMMQGSIQVTSKKNEGSTFTVLLSLERSEESLEMEQRTAQFTGIRILVVEQDEEERERILQLLKRCKIKRDVVRDLEAATKQFKRRAGSDFAYQICLIDWDTLEDKSVEAIHNLHQLEAAEGIFFVILTYDEETLSAEVKKAGVDLVLSKPLFQSNLVDMLMNRYGKVPSNDKNRISPETFCGMHVLIAEDNDMNMEIALHVLKKAGIVADGVRDGKEAVAQFQQEAPGTYQAILMDIQMPVMDGYEAAQQIRALEHPQAHTIPIIALTANAFAEDVSKALNAGMNEHIAKPMNEDKLYEALFRVMEKQNTCDTEHTHKEDKEND